MLLSFNTKTVPRSTTRKQWRGMYRCLRLMSKIVEAQVTRQIQNVLLYGTPEPN